MAGAKWCIMLNFAGPVGDCCIILDPKLDEKVGFDHKMLVVKVNKLTWAKIRPKNG